MNAIEILFWILAASTFWVYFGYFLFLIIVSKIFYRKTIKDDITPGVSVVITAYNEERRIAEKLENTLALDYPHQSLEIIVVNDCSGDKTADIVKAFDSDRIKIINLQQRRGKHYGQKRGIDAANNEIIVCTDATTFLPEESVREIVKAFADDRVGCVSSLDQMMHKSSQSSGEGFYVKYEMFLRSLESKINSLIGVSGCFFAVRKSLCDNWHINLSSDFFLPLNTYLNGYRSVLEEQAVSYYDATRAVSKEFMRKVRTVVHGMEVFFKYKRLLNPFKYGLFSFQ
jgi:cellulose synthase/poly-beta-1,6-N-acetylglucosamine synthase-like glycosyltransferase